MDAINNPKTITFLAQAQDKNIFIDQLYNGNVDQGDLDALSGEAYQTAVLQFTGERLSVSDYDAFRTQFAKDFPTGSFRDNDQARKKYTNGDKPKTGLGDLANIAGHTLVSDFLKDIFTGKLTDYVGASDGKVTTDKNGKKTISYVIKFNQITITYTEGVEKDKNGKEVGNGQIQGGTVQ